METWIIFLISFVVILVIVAFLNHNFDFLKDESISYKKPYSFARVQLTWWTIIIISSLISVFFVTQDIPTFNESTLILLGLSSATFAFARVIDVSDKSSDDNPKKELSRDTAGKNLVIDILSDKTGISVHRFQAAIFNLIFGAWFVSQVLIALNTEASPESVFPLIASDNLILLGLSSATYAAVKANENK